MPTNRRQQSGFLPLFDRHVAIAAVFTLALFATFSLIATSDHPARTVASARESVSAVLLSTPAVTGYATTPFCAPALKILYKCGPGPQQIQNLCPPTSGSYTKKNLCKAPDVCIGPAQGTQLRFKCGCDPALTKTAACNPNDPFSVYNACPKPAILKVCPRPPATAVPLKCNAALNPPGCDCPPEGKLPWKCAAPGANGISTSYLDKCNVLHDCNKEKGGIEWQCKGSPPSCICPDAAKQNRYCGKDGTGADVILDGCGAKVKTCAKSQKCQRLSAAGAKPIISECVCQEPFASSLWCAQAGAENTLGPNGQPLMPGTELIINGCGDPKKICGDEQVCKSPCPDPAGGQICCWTPPQTQQCTPTKTCKDYANAGAGFPMKWGALPNGCPDGTATPPGTTISPACACPDYTRKDDASKTSGDCLCEDNAACPAGFGCDTKTGKCAKFCGDNIVQKPNDAGKNEECDGTNTDGKTCQTAFPKQASLVSPSGRLFCLKNYCLFDPSQCCDSSSPAVWCGSSTLGSINHRYNFCLGEVLPACTATEKCVEQGEGVNQRATCQQVCPPGKGNNCQGQYALYCGSNLVKTCDMPTSGSPGEVCSTDPTNAQWMMCNAMGGGSTGGTTSTSTTSGTTGTPTSGGTTGTTTSGGCLEDSDACEGKCGDVPDPTPSCPVHKCGTTGSYCPTGNVCDKNNKCCKQESVETTKQRLCSQRPAGTCGPTNGETNCGKSISVDCGCSGEGQSCVNGQCSQTECTAAQVSLLHCETKNPPKVCKIVDGQPKCVCPAPKDAQLSCDSVFKKNIINGCLDVVENCETSYGLGFVCKTGNPPTCACDTAPGADGAPAPSAKRDCSKDSTQIVNGCGEMVASCSGSGSVCRKDASGVPSCVKCGNNIVDGLENCDDGNSDETDACNNACDWTKCGDGIVQKMNPYLAGYKPRGTTAPAADQGKNYAWTSSGNGLTGYLEQCDGTAGLPASCTTKEGVAGVPTCNSCMFSCSCTPKTAAQLCQSGWECGFLDNGCKTGSVACGSKSGQCPLVDTAPGKYKTQCDANHKCVCQKKDKSLACYGRECGEVDDGCGDKYYCGTTGDGLCPVPPSGMARKTCNSLGKCECTNPTVGTGCNAQGLRTNACGDTLGGCPTGTKCGAGKCICERSDYTFNPQTNTCGCGATGKPCANTAYTCQNGACACPDNTPRGCKPDGTGKSGIKINRCGDTVGACATSQAPAVGAEICVIEGTTSKCVKEFCTGGYPSNVDEFGFTRPPRYGETIAMTASASTPNQQGQTGQCAPGVTPVFCCDGIAKCASKLDCRIATTIPPRCMGTDRCTLDSNSGCPGTASCTKCENLYVNGVCCPKGAATVVGGSGQVCCMIDNKPCVTYNGEVASIPPPEDSSTAGAAIFGVGRLQSPDTGLSYALPSFFRWVANVLFG